RPASTRLAGLSAAQHRHTECTSRCMAGESRSSRIMILVAAVSASAAAVGVIGASCLERGVEQRATQRVENKARQSQEARDQREKANAAEVYQTPEGTIR